MALKHCRLQNLLGCKLGSEQEQLHFSRRRDLRYIFVLAEDILSQHCLEQNFEMTITVRKYVKTLLEGYVDCVMHSPHIEIDEDSLERDSTCCTSTTSSASFCSSSSITSQAATKERLSVRSDSNDCIEVQLEVFVPAVVFLMWLNATSMSIDQSYIAEVFHILPVLREKR
eukprot:CCRYP_012410-RA/>CCRYP_012410-RA protein AED:0.46 eAED:0.46 QI:0/-1/0/1/-1/1/1/0/170